VLLLGAGVLSQVPRGLRGELFRGVPSWMLVQLQPLFPENENAYTNHPSRELSERLNDTKNPDRHAQVVAIIHDLAKGSVFSKAGSERWGRTSGKWFGARAFWFGFPGQDWQYPDLTPADDALRNALEELMRVLPGWDPSTRARWPEGYRVKIKSGSFRPDWPTIGDLNERAILRLEGYDEIVRDGFVRHFGIEPIGSAGDVIEGEIELSYFRVRVWERDETAEPVRTERFPIRWEVVADVEDAVEIVTDDSLLDDVKIDLVLASRSGEFYAAVMQNPAFDVHLSDGIGVGLRVTLSDGEGPITEWYVSWLYEDGALAYMSTGGANYVPSDEVDSRLDKAMLNNALRVHVVGDPQLALENLEAEKIWEGGFEMMYHEAVQEKTPPESTGP